MADVDASLSWYRQLPGREPDVVVNVHEVMWGLAETACLHRCRWGPGRPVTSDLGGADLHQALVEDDPHGH